MRRPDRTEPNEDGHRSNDDPAPMDAAAVHDTTVMRYAPSNQVPCINTRRQYRDASQQNCRAHNNSLDSTDTRRYTGIHMTLLRQRFAQRAGTMLVLVSLLVPLAFSGHGHRNAQLGGADACPVCVATHHSPAVSAPPIPQPPPVLPILTVATTVIVAPVVVAHPTHSGRAPPFSLLSRVA
jgi:hypothetical protein